MAVAESLRTLDTSARGLATSEATRRLAAIGPNELEASDRTSPWSLLVAQFRNILIIILLIAVGLSVVLGDVLEAIVIGVIVVFAVLLGFVQEFRAERAIEALRDMAAPTARVLRDGEEYVIQASEVVPGDIVLLHVGDRIPADLRLVEAFNLQTDEAPLTGESVPVEKHTLPIENHHIAVADRRNMAYSGTVVTYGRGLGAVTGTGMRTEFGKIAGMLQTVEVGQTPLQKNLDRVGKVLAVVALVVVGIIVVLGVSRGQEPLEMLLFGIALAVAVVPEALPAVVTISLAMGVRRIVKRKALIRRLPAVETLGSTSVICSDKTGTLTRNEMTVRRIFAAGVSASLTGSGYDPEGDLLVDDAAAAAPQTVVELLRTAALASDATLAHDVDGRRVVRGDPTEGALVVAAAKLGMDKHELEARYPRTEELPFSSERKRMTTLHEDAGSVFACSKGAAEVILDACSTVLSESGVASLDETARRSILSTAESLAGEGIRVLGIARKPDALLATAEQGMTFLGLAGLVDPPRPEAASSVAACRGAGIGVVMITGDHPVTAAAIAREVGILDEGRVVTGRELEQMTDDQLTEEVADIEVYARVSPADKLRIVTAWQGRDAVVAMTGDGVNDAPALKKSDIGVAMAIVGTDVSREASEMVLLDDNFASIVAAVEEGRGIFGNIKKYLMYLISSNIGETLLIAAATVAGMPLPLSAVQILYVNLATDGLPALALSVDPAEPDLMHRPPRDPRRGIFTRPVVTLMSLGGVWSAIVNFAVFATTRAAGGSDERAMANTFVCLVLIEFFKAYNFRSDRRSVFDRPFANRWLNLAILWELLLLAAIMYVPFLQEAFGTYALNPAGWLALLGVAASIIPVLETGKWLARRGWLGEMD
ncbi:MAG: cation-translocating P-type ATPase [Acidimicrobiia bacterium]|nr:cation-translocating P-type ATPase [Acidimicrobiia bacterium]